MHLRLASEYELSKPLTGSVEDMLRSINSIRIYLDLLKKNRSEYLIVLAVKDTPGNLPEDVIDRLHGLGFKSFVKAFRRMYIGVSLMSDIICDKSGAETEEPVSFDYAKDGLDLKIASQSISTGNKASIVINNNECAVKLRGLNIVVYDPVNMKLVDSVAIDTFTDKWRFLRH